MGILTFRTLHLIIFLTVIFLIIGSLALERILYLQFLPSSQIPSCIPPLDYLIEIAPFFDISNVMLTGSEDCAEVQWFFLGLTIPGWAFLFFAGFVLLTIATLLNQRNQEHFL